MNLAQVKCLSVLAIFAGIGFGPVSPTCLIGFYIVAMRPLWFFTFVGDLYNNQAQFRTNNWPNPGRHAIAARIKCSLCLSVLFILDIAPIPVTALIALPIVLGRPDWFKHIVLNVYGKNQS